MKDIELQNIDKTYYCYIGYESIVYPYNKLLLKYFRDKELEDFIESRFKKTHDLDWYNEMRGKTISEEELKNKEKKVHMIPYLKCLKNEIEIYDSIYINGIFKGYTMENSYYRKINSEEKLRNKIEILKMIKRKIEYLNACSIFIGDFNTRNFLVSPAKNDVMMCDLDNLKIFNLDFDTKPESVNRFNSKCNKKEYIDSYCFNIFTICLLSNIHDGYFEFSKHYLPKILNTEENRKIFDSMEYLDNSYQKKYLIDNLR